MATFTCEELVYPRGRYGLFQGYRCGKKASVERDGHHYCGTHDPVKIAERDKLRDEKYQAESKVRHDAWERERLVKLVCAGVDADSLKKLGEGWLLTYLLSQTDPT